MKHSFTTIFAILTLSAAAVAETPNSGSLIFSRSDTLYTQLQSHFEGHGFNLRKSNHGAINTLANSLLFDIGSKCYQLAVGIEHFDSSDKMKTRVHAIKTEVTRHPKLNILMHAPTWVRPQVPPTSCDGASPPPMNALKSQLVTVFKEFEKSKK